MAEAPEFTAAEQAHMLRALRLAERGRFGTDPNPRVGCVLVRDEQVVGEGWHERAGEAHAEVRALAAAGGAARGATAFVTLEPCAAAGRTPACTGALLAAGVAEVVYAASDPDPRMRQGAERLRAGGCAVRGGLLATEARALNPGFHKRHETGLPWVRVKLAASLDGRTALASGESRWITADAARKDSQAWRAQSSVVLSGIGTILADDPALNVRLPDAQRQPRRVVLDSHWRTPIGARVLHREGAALVIGVADSSGSPHAADAEARWTALTKAGAETLALAAGADGRVPLEPALRELARRAANEVWVESGATLAGALMSAGLVDELIVYLAPCALGDTAQPMLRLPPLRSLAARHRLEFEDCVRIGPDLRLRARVLAPTVEDRLAKDRPGEIS